jgi:ribosomal protein S27E
MTRGEPTKSLLGAKSMSITVTCPGCGKAYAVDDKHAGRQFACKTCGGTIRVTAPEAAPKLSVACDQCGKAHWVAAEHVGKKTTCKGCGAVFRIQAGAAAPVRSEPARPSAARSRAPESPPPPDVDVYGLDEPPEAPRAQASPAVEASSASPNGDDSASLPKRIGAYKPLTAAQKKKIAKRAAKIEKTKVSNATVGVSFGAVLAIALFGWRIYRVVHRFERAAKGIDAAQTAPGDVVELDPKSAADAVDKEVADMIGKPGTAEAREWLDTAKYPNHAVMEMPTPTAQEMVAGFYERGAEKVYVVDPTSINGTLLTAQIAVKLPKDPAQRKQCLEWAAKYEGGESPDADVGQKYLLITTD